MDDLEEALGFSWGHEIVPTSSGAPNEEALKKTREYSSFHLEGIAYHLHDTVYLVAYDGPRDIAKILKLYENVNKKEKCMLVRWFCRSRELPARVAGVNYSDEDSKEIFIAWGYGSKSVVDPASTIRKCSVVCIAPQDWNKPHPTRERIAAADHFFGYAFTASSKQVVSLDGPFKKFGLKYFKDCRVRSPDISQTTGATQRKAVEDGSKVAEKVAKSDCRDDPRPRQRASHTSVAVSKSSGGSEREAVERGTKVSGRNREAAECGTEAGGSKREAIECGTEAAAKGVQGGTHKKARVDVSNQGEGGPSIQELIAVAHQSKQRHLESKRPSSEPASLKKPVARDSWPIGHGEQHLQNPVTLKRSTVRDPLPIRPSACLKIVSSVDKSNETSKSVQKELAGKQVQDGLNPSLRVNRGFSNMPWHVVLDVALEQGRALLLQNLDPLFSSRDIQDMLTGLLSVSCEARMLLPRDFSCYTSGEALVVFQTLEEAEDAFLKFTQNVLILSEDQRPVVASLANKQRRAVNPFLGFLNLGMFNVQLPQMGCSTSHFSQPNTVVFDMGMQWRVLQEQHSEAWRLLAQVLRITRRMPLFDGCVQRFYACTKQRFCVESVYGS